MNYLLKSALRLTLQLLLLGFPLGLQAQVDPKIEWKEIETSSAYWLYDAKHHEAATYYIRQFERAKQEVLPLFKEESRKMTIVLLDNTDMANGSARVVPYPIISLNMVQPLAYSSIGEFKDFVHELLVHEYTHILNMEPVHGWISPAYWIFGSVAHPNMMLPRWYTEGLAVYTESAISKTGGRLNSQYLGGLARSLTLENKWDQYPLSQLNDWHPDWLGASRAYLFGGILWESMAADHPDVIHKLNQSYSRRVPFFLDGALEYHLGVDYDQQLEKAYQRWQNKTQEQIKTIQSQPHPQGHQVMTELKDTRLESPKFSPDGAHLTFTASDIEGNGHIYLVPRDGQKGFIGENAEKIIDDARALSVAWHPASTGFVYEKLDTFERYNRFYDLYFYDLKSGESQRVTKGMRAHFACFSPDGKTLYYMSNKASGKNIIAMNWEKKEGQIVYQGTVGSNMDSLLCPRQDEISFRLQPPGEKARLKKLKLKDNVITSPIDNFPVQALVASSQGVLISSPQSGVDNIYLWDGQKQPRAVTNSLTRSLTGDIDPYNDSLLYSRATSEGPKLFELKKHQWSQVPPNPPQVPSLFAQNTGNEKEPKSLLTEESLQLKSEDFSPWRYLYPNHWIPFLYVVDQGMIFQAMTSAGDPLGINTISLTAQWDTLTKKPGASLSYFNRSTPVTLGASVSDFYSYFYPTESSLHFSNAAAVASYALPFLDYTQMLVRWNYSSLSLSPLNFIRQGPTLQFSYNQTKRRAFDISTRSGWRMELGHSEYLEDLGNVDYGETYAHLGTFWSSFTPQRHVLYLGFNGSYAPELFNSLFQTSTLAGPFFNPQIVNTAFLQRGYPTGVFLARNILNINMEYRFPLFDIFRGLTGPPVFFKNIQAAFVFDASTLDGRYSETSTRGIRATDFGRFFTGYGLELESNMTAAFFVPVTFTLGLYYGEEQESFGGFTTFFNVRL